MQERYLPARVVAARIPLLPHNPAWIPVKPTRIPMAQTGAGSPGEACRELAPDPPARPGTVYQRSGYLSRQVSDQPGAARPSLASLPTMHVCADIFRAVASAPD